MRCCTMLCVLFVKKVIVTSSYHFRRTPCMNVPSQAPRIKTPPAACGVPRACPKPSNPFRRLPGSESEVCMSKNCCSEHSPPSSRYHRCAVAAAPGQNDIGLGINTTQRRKALHASQDTATISKTSTQIYWQIVAKRCGFCIHLC